MWPKSCYVICEWPHSRFLSFALDLKKIEILGGFAA